MNDKIPSTTEAESAGFPPYGTGVNNNNRKSIGMKYMISWFERSQGSPMAYENAHPNALARIRAWAQTNGFHAVVWTALGPRFKDGPPGVPFTPAAALDYLLQKPSQPALILS